MHPAIHGKNMGQLEFVLWFGPLPVRWTALHEPGPIDTSFQDRMLRGPLDIWVHQHIFREVPGGVELTDHLEYQHHEGLRGICSRLLFGGLPQGGTSESAGVQSLSAP